MPRRWNVQRNIAGNISETSTFIFDQDTQIKFCKKFEK